MLKAAQRTHTCGELNEDNLGANVTLQGWVDSARDLGGLTFIDLRDRYGVTQITADERTPEHVRNVLSGLRQEYVVLIKGVVEKRSRPNSKIYTGQIEVVAQEVELLSRSKPLPFAVRDDVNAHEETRLRYRYIDLRRPSLGKNFVVRHKAAQAVRRYLDSESFLEIETPVLSVTTPEGARDYLIPSRVQKNQWYALPQSPQLFKQLLMVSGMDRYFQIVKCFRDEDLRADRQPEFTQIDVEISFANRELVLEVGEGIVRSMWSEILGYEIPEIPRLTYAEAMERFGRDAPDIRFGLEHKYLTEVLKGTQLKILADAIDAGGIVKGFVVPDGAKVSRKVLDSYSAFVKSYKLGGVLTGKVANGGVTGPLAKLEQVYIDTLIDMFNAKEGDLIILGAGPISAVHAGLGNLRVFIAKELNIVPQGFAFCWVTDFPAFEYDEEQGRFMAMHHPFTAPIPEHVEMLGTGREAEICSNAYDLVCNGYEIGGGSVRIHDSSVQERVFAAIGIEMEEARKKFGFLLDALMMGAPPHAGIAFGFDRCIMLLAGTENIRDVIAFPKTTAAQDLMTGAPSPVSESQLLELSVKNL